MIDVVVIMGRIFVWSESLHSSDEESYCCHIVLLFALVKVKVF
jgi:hypothetical protein